MNDVPEDRPSDLFSGQADRQVVRLTATPKFIKAYKSLPLSVRERVDVALRKFLKDPRHPGLHFEKLQGSDYRTIRSDRKMYRIVLRDAEARDEKAECFDLIDVDRHSVVDRKYG